MRIKCQDSPDLYRGPSGSALTWGNLIRPRAFVLARGWPQHPHHHHWQYHSAQHLGDSSRMFVSQRLKCFLVLKLEGCLWLTKFVHFLKVCCVKVTINHNIHVTLVMWCMEGDNIFCDATEMVTAGDPESNHGTALTTLHWDFCLWSGYLFSKINIYQGQQHQPWLSSFSLIIRLKQHILGYFRDISVL